MSRSPRAIIIGGGFSGTMVALHLARHDINSVIIDPAEREGRGIAYSTKCPHHLLNVRAGNMSAFPHKPDDFASFIALNGDQPDAFAKRSDYGDYLQSLLDRAIKGGLVSLVRQHAIGASPVSGGWQVSLDGGGTLSAEALVLALGNRAPARLEPLRAIAADDLIDLFWTSQASSRLEMAAANDEPVLIIGTGLTMVDALLSLDFAGHRGPIIAVSRHGLLPLPHAPASRSILPPPQLEDIPVRLSEMMEWVRRRASMESDWRLAIDSIRPITRAIWARMDGETRARFLRHGRTLWDVHRHRLAPNLRERVDELLAERRLQILAGRLEGAIRQCDRYSLSIKTRGRGKIEVDAGLVINCTGPVCALHDNSDRLIAQMIADDLIRADALQLGIEVDETDRLPGLADAFAIGPIAKGRYWEMTAVPDLRVKAAEIAASITVAFSSGNVEFA